MYTGNEKFIFKDKDLGKTMLNFWSWAYSDLIRNVNRGAFAEFVVREAMNTQCRNTPPEQIFVYLDAYDLLSPDGIRVEVKSSAYIQAWESEHPARISFRIAPAKSLTHPQLLSRFSILPGASDVYVFCVWTTMSREQNMPDLSLWDFYVIATKTLDQKVPNQKTITFQSLLSLQLKEG